MLACFMLSVFIAVFSLRLIDTTNVDETNEMYITKLALSVGRSTFLIFDFVYHLLTMPL